MQWALGYTVLALDCVYNSLPLPLPPSRGSPSHYLFNFLPLQAVVRDVFTLIKFPMNLPTIRTFNQTKLGVSNRLQLLVT